MIAHVNAEKLYKLYVLDGLLELELQKVVSCRAGAEN